MEENTTVTFQGETKFCKECGQKIAKKAVICPHCGCQVEETAPAAAATPQIVINNSNQNQNQNHNANQNMAMGMPFGARMRNKWVALLLCICLGWLGAHKFYEGKGGMGIVYLFTFGLFGIGIFFDFFTLLSKPNPYFVI